MQEAKKLRSGIKAETFHPICPRVKFPTPEVLEGPPPKPQTFFSSGSWSSSSTVARAASASRAECRCAECNLTAEGFVCWGLFCSGFIYLLCCFCVCGVLCFALFYLLLVLACSFCLFVLLLFCLSAFLLPFLFNCFSAVLSAFCLSLLLVFCLLLRLLFCSSAFCFSALMLRSYAPPLSALLRFSPLRPSGSTLL